MNRIIEQVSRISSAIRYIALYQNDELVSWQKDGLNNSSASDSDTYEELLVNPTILKIARQRGNIDCGGLDFVIIKYGNFYQLISEIENGHISICIESHENPIALEAEIMKALNFDEVTK